VQNWLQSLRALPQDGFIRARIACLEKKLEDITSEKNPKGAAPAVLLLRAISLTKKRERQKAVAIEKAEHIGQQIAKLCAEHDEARLNVFRAEALLDEANEKEKALRAGLAPQSGDDTDVAAASLSDLIGLQMQLRALPAAAASGNMDAAHQAIMCQASAIIDRLTGADGPDQMEDVPLGEYMPGHLPQPAPVTPRPAAPRDPSSDPDPAATPQGTPPLHSRRGRGQQAPESPPVRSRSRAQSERSGSEASHDPSRERRALRAASVGSRRIDQMWGPARRRG